MVIPPTLSLLYLIFATHIMWYQPHTQCSSTEDIRLAFSTFTCTVWSYLNTDWIGHISVEDACRFVLTTDMAIYSFPSTCVSGDAWRQCFFPIGCMALTEIIQVFKILHCFPEIIFKSHHTPLITQTDCTVKQTKVLSMAPVMYKI